MIDLKKNSFYQNLIVVLLSVFGIGVSIVVFFPGWMSADSLSQYAQALSSQYNDWQPPLMAWWWNKLLNIANSPAPFLVQNILFYWTGLALLALSFRKRHGVSALLIVLAGFFPGLWLVLGNIWKDVAFACTMLLVWGWVLFAYTHATAVRLWMIAPLMLLLAFAFGVKTNGITAIVPLLLFVFIVLRYPDKNGSVFKSFQWLVVVVVASLLILMVEKSLLINTKIYRTHVFQYQQMHDLLGISVNAKKNLLPEYINQRQEIKSFDQLVSFYTPESANPLAYGGNGAISQNEEHLLDLKNKWFDAVVSHPREYLIHRWSVFKSLLRIGYPSPAYVTTGNTDTNSFGFTYKSNGTSQWLLEQRSKNSWLFFPWVYLCLLSFGVFISFVLKKNRFFTACFAGSAILFLLPHFFISPASDFRYLYYFYMVSILTFIFASLDTLFYISCCFKNKDSK